MNEPDLNQFSGKELPWFPGQLLLVLTSLFASLMLAGAAWAFSDQSADLQLQARDRREQQRLALGARVARPEVLLAQAPSAGRASVASLTFAPTSAGSSSAAPATGVPATSAVSTPPLPADGASPTLPAARSPQEAQADRRSQAGRATAPSKVRP